MAPGLRSQTPEGALEQVLNLFKGEKMKKLFDEAGIADIIDLLAIGDVNELKEVSVLEAEVGDQPNIVTISLAEIGKLKTILAWYAAQDDSSLNTWYKLDEDTFKDFVMSRTTKLSQVTSQTPSAMQNTGLLSGVKRDLSHYPRLREDKMWISFNRILNSMAATHAVSEVLDPHYVPKTSEVEAFKVKNTFMYSVFTHCLVTAKAKVPLRAHEKTMDAQAVYRDLLAAYADGTTAHLSAESLENQLRNMKLDSTWNKSLETFLHTWSTRLYDLEDVRDDTISTSDKKRWLINSIKGHANLYQGVNTAKSVEQAMKSMSGCQKMTWEQYFNLILDHAQTLDSNNPTTTRKSQKANNSSQQRGNQQGQNSQGRRNPNKYDDFIPKDKWNAMTDDERKAVIDKRKKQKRQAKKSRQQSQSGGNPSLSNDNGTNSHANQTTNQTPQTTPAQNPGTNSTRAQGSQPSQSERFLAQAQQQPRSIVVDGVTYTASVTNITYHMNKSKTATSLRGSLIDRGANGGLSGSDVRVISSSTTNFADVQGIAGAEVNNIPLSTVAGVLNTTSGPVIGIFHQYAHYGKGQTLHSPLQMEAFGLDVYDHSIASGKIKPRITTPDGFHIPLEVRMGLVYMSMHVPTDEDMDSLPHVTMTSDSLWNPSVFDTDCSFEELENPFKETSEESKMDNDFWEEAQSIDANVASCILACKSHIQVLMPRSILPKTPDFHRLRPYFGWIPHTRVRDTLKCTTQWYRAEGRLPMRRHFKSRFPGANVPRREETVATDTIFSDTPAHDDGIPGHGGCTMMQFFCGCSSEFAAAFPMSQETQVHKAVEDFIRYYGAPRNLFNDNAKSEISKKVQDILRHYTIGQYRSEPHQQNQNPAERRIQDIKKHTNILMDRTGTPAPMWLLCMLYVIELHNHLASSNLTHHTTPIQKAFGFVPDVSKFLQFHWWQRVLYKSDSMSFPSSTYEGIGRFVGIATNIGDLLTYFVLTDDTQQVIARSNVRTLDPENPNVRVLHPEHEGESLSGDDEQAHRPVVRSLVEDYDPEYDPEKVKLPKFSPEELLGLTFLHDTADGQRVRAEVVKRIQDRDSENHQNIKFIIKYGDPEYEEIISYNELSDTIERQHGDELDAEEKLYVFKKIISHHGPIKPSDPQYKGSMWNLRIEWEDGTITMEPLSTIAADDPATCAKYAKEHNLLELEGWKRFKRLARRTKKMQRMINQVALAAKKKGPVYKFGIRIPKNEAEARELDKKYKETIGEERWKLAEETEVSQLHDYTTFKDHGRNRAPPGYRYIKVFFVYDVKHDLRHKARLVAGGHMTPECDNSYSSVISLKGMRVAILMGEINGLKTMVGDVGNAYLEAYTKEKVCFIAGPAFGPLEGHTLIIVKALYGLRTSGARYHERFADTLRDMKFFQCKNEQDLWMRDAGDHYEYVCVYVDDLMAIMKDPSSFFKELTEKYGYKLKGVDDPKYHLGGNYFRDPDGTLAWGAKDYINRMLENFARDRQEIPRKYRSPMDKDAHPELETAMTLGLTGVKYYQSVIGALQWCVTLGRFDIACAVMTMSRFRAEPNAKHHEMLDRIIGYLRHTKDAAIRFRTDVPDYEEFEEPEYDWDETVYSGVEEDIPDDVPTPKGKAVRLTTYVDANLMHCRSTGRAATGIIHIH